MTQKLYVPRFRFGTDIMLLPNNCVYCKYENKEKYLHTSGCVT